MSYMIHMNKSVIELTDEEYEILKECLREGNWFRRKSTGEMINPSFVTHTERVPELPKNNPNAVDEWMENKRNQDKTQSDGNKSDAP